MINSQNSPTKVVEDSVSQSSSSEKEPSPKKGPVNFFIGAVTSGLLGWLCFRLSQSMVTYFSLHSTDYSSPIAQSIASGFKTLIIGMSFLATFTFSFIGLGLVIVFFRSLFAGKDPDTA